MANKKILVSVEKNYFNNHVYVDETRQKSCDCFLIIIGSSSIFPTTVSLESFLLAHENEACEYTGEIHLGSEQT